MWTSELVEAYREHIRRQENLSFFSIFHILSRGTERGQRRQQSSRVEDPEQGSLLLPMPRKAGADDQTKPNGTERGNSGYIRRMKVIEAIVSVKDDEAEEKEKSGGKRLVPGEWRNHSSPSLDLSSVMGVADEEGRALLVLFLKS